MQLSARQFLAFPDVHDAWVPYLEHLRVRLRKDWWHIDGEQRHILEWVEVKVENALFLNLADLRRFDRLLKRLVREHFFDHIVVRESFNESVKAELVRLGYRRARDGKLWWANPSDRPLPANSEHCPVCQARLSAERAPCPHVRWNRRFGRWYLRRVPR